MRPAADERSGDFPAFYSTAPSVELSPFDSFGLDSEGAAHQTSLLSMAERKRQTVPSFRAVKDITVKKGKKKPHKGMDFVNFQPTVAVSQGLLSMLLPVDARTWTDISQILTSIRQERDREG